ncbi:putative acyl-CoA synthetase YngI [Mycena sanguinolenta]|uniref:Putative acyl-CoA synthetase YngI n=1 Tax=Mycena sanguinolenta TaxID=230812 RepID=A0A8H6XZ85_9AGAR|nr:putative acyl-CoA synthetase YngI [Mycena sanguinolenta]
MSLPLPRSGLRRFWPLQEARTGFRLKTHWQRRHLSWSSVEGALEPPLATSTLSQYFKEEILHKHNSRPALICRTETPRAHGGPPSINLDIGSHLAWSFEEFDRHIDALARGLLRMGVEKGDRVGVVMGNNSAYAMLQWACASIGAILVTINPAYRVNELTAVLNLTNSPELPTFRNFVVVDNTGHFPQEADKLGLKNWIDWREIMVWDESSRENSLQKGISSSLHRDDIINIQFTSGTTGAPKGVSLTHSNLLNNGLSIGNLAAWTHGACIVYPSEIFNPKAVVDTVVEEKCTALHGVPTHFLGVLAEVDRRRASGETVDTSRLRTGIAAGSPVPIELMKSLIAKINLSELTNAYGMTETSPVSFQTIPTDPIIKRVETVGRVQPHVKAKLIDPNGNIVPVGVPGEICVAGYLLQKGYWEDEAQTRQAMRTDENGTLWMHTGDEGIMDEEGYLRIVSRIKDMIIRGGENLFPIQIENVILTNPEIEEAAVVSVPDSRYGEVVGAWIVRKPGATISREAVRATVTQSMNPQNAPAWVFFIGEDGTASELPKTASGKVMKHVLRDWSRDLASRNVGFVASPSSSK